MPVVRKNSSAAVAPPIGAYAHLAVIPPGAEIVVLAGQLGIDRDGVPADGLAAQFRLALENARLILAAEGLTAGDVIKANLWFAERMERAQFLDIWSGFHGGDPPPATYVVVDGFVRPGLLVEVEIWAARSPVP